MFLLDEPYVSKEILETARQSGIPIIETPTACSRGWVRPGAGISEGEAVNRYRNQSARLYTNSEHALSWVADHLGDTGLPQTVDQFKNKVAFRELTADLYPGVFFREIPFSALDTVDPHAFPLPFVIKPAVGFFSLGVHTVHDPDDWFRVRDAIIHNRSKLAGTMPAVVLDDSTFIVEGMIPGDEYAIDAYFDADGRPVVLNILRHLFASESDVSDRVYISSREILQRNMADVTAFLSRIGQRMDLRRFPLHVEVRRTPDGLMIPIEINPLRFGGWCTTADMTRVAYGFDPYLYYFQDRRPDWDAVFRERGDRVYSIIVLDNTTGRDGADIRHFDYGRLSSCLESPLAVREIDWRTHPVFGFVFAQTRPDNLQELEKLLVSDLSEFIR